MPALMPVSSLLVPMRLQMVQHALSGSTGTTPGPGLALRVDFADGALRITPRIPTPPARFSVAFGDGSLTIIS